MSPLLVCNYNFGKRTAEFCFLCLLWGTTCCCWKKGNERKENDVTKLENRIGIYWKWFKMCLPFLTESDTNETGTIIMNIVAGHCLVLFFSQRFNGNKIQSQIVEWYKTLVFSETGCFQIVAEDCNLAKIYGTSLVCFNNVCDLRITHNYWV